MGEGGTEAGRRWEKVMGDGLRGCNTSEKWENVAVMTQICCGVALTWDGLCLAER